MTPLDLVQLTPLMARTQGSPAVPIALIDGPVATTHPGLSQARVSEIALGRPLRCEQARSAACLHGTFVAGVLAARRGGIAPAIAPACPLLVRPIFSEADDAGGMPRTHPEELARAILDCISAGARVLNVSAGLVGPSPGRLASLERALDDAARRGVIVVTATGNSGSMAGSTLSNHAWVVPVVACDRHGKPADFSNLGRVIARTGLSAPGVAVTSLGSTGGLRTLTGTSAAVPFVAGAVALLWSEFPAATAGAIRFAVTNADRPRRRSAVPPLLDAWAAYRTLLGS
jgi:subtilisin family serine protease